MPVPFPFPRAIAPTDNLSKFVSIFGLTFLVLAVVLWSIRVYQHNEKIAAAHVDQAVAAIRTQHLTSDLTRLRDVMQDSRNELQDLAKQFHASTQPAAAQSEQIGRIARVADQASTAASGFPTVIDEALTLQVEAAKRAAEVEMSKSILDASRRDLT